MEPSKAPPGRIAVLGGTGKEGRGLARRWARAGRAVVIGSRDAGRGRAAAEELRASVEGGSLEGTSNREAAERCEILVSTLPDESHVEILGEIEDALRGKLLVTATIAWPPGLDGEPSAAEALAEAIGESCRVVAAFQTVSAKTLSSEEAEEEDVLVFSDDASARSEAVALIAEMGLRGVEAGKLANARVAEALTGLLIAVNKLYGVKSSGIRLTGLPG